MAPRARRWATAGAIVAVLAAVGLGVWLLFPDPKPPPAPPAPPPPPPKWECGTAYGEEICERGLPPARPAP